MTELIEIIDSLGFWLYFPIIMLVVIPVMRYILRLGSDDDDDDDDDNDDKESFASKVIPRRNETIGRLTGMTMIPKQRREKSDISEVVSGLYREDHDPNIIKQKVKIQSNNNPEPILCPNCGISVMTQWKKCYHCGELL